MMSAPCTALATTCLRACAMTEETALQPAWLLHHQSYRDTSLIIDVFSLNRGRVALMARSARAARPAIRELYQPFRPLLLSWVGEGSLKTLTGIEAADRPLDLAPKPQACAYYLNELVLRLCDKEHPQPELFAWYGLALSELAGGVDVESVLRQFELQLLESLGLLPDFARATEDHAPVQAGVRYRYHAANAVAVALSNDAPVGLLKPEKVRGPDPRWHADGVTEDPGVEVSGATLLALAAMDLDDPDVREEARPLMKRVLRVHLGDRPLNSRRFFESLAGSEAKPSVPS